MDGENESGGSSSLQPYYRDVFKFDNGKSICFRILPEQEEDTELRDLIEIAGGTVMDTGESDPFAITLIDTLYLLRSRTGPPLDLSEFGSVFSPSFVYDSYMRNRVQDLNTYRLSSIVPSVFDFNLVMARKLTWNDAEEVFKKEPTSPGNESWSPGSIKSVSSEGSGRAVQASSPRSRTTGTRNVIETTPTSSAVIMRSSVGPPRKHISNSLRALIMPKLNNKKPSPPRGSVTPQVAAQVAADRSPNANNRRPCSTSASTSSASPKQAPKAQTARRSSTPGPRHPVNNSQSGSGTSTGLRPVVRRIPSQEPQQRPTKRPPITIGLRSRSSTEASASGPSPKKRTDPVEVDNSSSDEDVSVSGLSTISPRKKTRHWRSYTKEDGKKMLRFIIERKLHDYYKGYEPWKQMEFMKIIPGRSYMSLWEHFRKKVIMDLASYGCPEDDAFKLRRAFRNKHTKKTAPLSLLFGNNVK